MKLYDRHPTTPLQTISYSGKLVQSIGKPGYSKNAIASAQPNKCASEISDFRKHMVCFQFNATLTAHTKHKLLNLSHVYVGARV